MSTAVIASEAHPTASKTAPGPDLRALAELSVLTEASAPAVLSFVQQRFGDRAAIASSFGVEDIVLLHLASVYAPSLTVFTLDTGRLPEETHEVMELVRRRFQLRIETFAPERAAVERLESEQGYYSFRASLQARKDCCGVRKVEPLRRALAGKQAWLTGLRREQTQTRTAIDVAGWDDGFGLWKFNPLSSWTTAQTWAYVQEHSLPYNRLHDLGYPSIGCAPCTRAVKPYEDLRAGRWWWENAEHKECGLHRQP